MSNSGHETKPGVDVEAASTSTVRRGSSSPPRRPALEFEGGSGMLQLLAAATEQADSENTDTTDNTDDTDDTAKFQPTISSNTPKTQQTASGKLEPQASSSSSSSSNSKPPLKIRASSAKSSTKKSSGKSEKSRKRKKLQLSLEEGQAKMGKLEEQTKMEKDTDDVELYCICNMPYDENIFMILCEHCENWFHGGCVQIWEQEAEGIDKYYCDGCRKKDSSLKIIRKTPVVEVVPVLPPPIPVCASATCNKDSTPPSKYCTKKCVLDEAKRNLEYLLQQAETDPVKNAHLGEHDAATRGHFADLEQCQREQQSVAERLKELTNVRVTLQDHIRNAEALTAKDMVSEDLIESDSTLAINCLLCGNEWPIKKAILHMVKCSRKYEMEMSVLASQPSELPGCPVQAFCNKLDKNTGQYCRRFYALCPEHGGPAVKVTLGNSSVVCGFPVENGVEKPGGKVCLRKKPKCNNHAFWETVHNMRLAMETVQQCLYGTYLTAQQEAIELRLSHKYTLANLIFHKQTEHDEKQAADIAKEALAKSQLFVSRNVLTGYQRDSNETGLTGGSLGLPRRFWR